MPFLARDQRDQMLDYLRLRFLARGVDPFDAGEYAVNIVAQFPLWGVL